MGDLTDRERTSILRDLVRERHEGTGEMGGAVLAKRWAVMEEVPPGTGFLIQPRYADVVALALWPSEDHKIVGYELKASKADLKRELAHLDKHLPVASRCDEWWLVVWSTHYLTGADDLITRVPASWGILARTGAEPAEDNALLVEAARDEHRLVRVRAATPNPAVKPLDRGWLASCVRRGIETGVGPTMLGRACAASYRRGIHAGENTGTAEERKRWEDALPDARDAFLAKCTAERVARQAAGERWPSVDTSRDAFMQWLNTLAKEAAGTKATEVPA